MTPYHVNRYGEPALLSLPDDKIIAVLQEQLKTMDDMEKKGQFKSAYLARKDFVQAVAGVTPDRTPFIEHFSPAVRKKLLEFVEETQKKEANYREKARAYNAIRASKEI